MTRGSLLRRAAPFVLVSMLGAAPAFAQALPPNVFESGDIDIDETWQGMGVSGKFGDDPAWHSYAGVVEGYTGTIACPLGTCAEGGFSANVVGPGHGEVKAFAALLHRMPDGNNLGTESQSVKPFTVAGEGPVDSTIRLAFDGLLVLRETSGVAGHWSEARVEFAGAIMHFDEEEGERQVFGDNFFTGMAAVRQYGDDRIEIIVPETYDDDLDDDIPNFWHGNDNLQIRRVVAGTAGENEISLASLTGNTRTEAQAHIEAGRVVYFLVYEQTFAFEAEGGQTYYVGLDLMTAANASDGGGFESTAFALADFSNTIVYELDAAGGVTTHLLFDGEADDGNAQAVAVATSNPFGGASSVLTLRDGGAMNVTAAGRSLAETIVLDDGVINTGGHTITLAGLLRGEGLVTGGGNLVAAGTVRPGNSIGTLTVDGATYTQGAASTLEIEFDAAGNSDRIEAVNNASIVIQSGATLTPVPLEPILQSGTYTFMTWDGTSSLTGTFAPIASQGLISYSLEVDAVHGEYLLHVDRASFASVAPSGQLGAVLDFFEADGGAPAALQDIIDAILLMTPEEAAEALERLEPDTTGGALAATGMATSALQNVVGTRTSSLRGGRSGGDMVANAGVWAQGFYGEATQRDRGGQRGYAADHKGFAVGIDAEVARIARLGLAYGHARSDADAAFSNTESTGHTLMLYGSYEGAGWYLDGMLSYGWHDYDSARDTGFGIARASYDGRQFAARADGGWPLALGPTVLTPTATLRYGRLSLDGYQETGAPGADLAVASQSFDTFTAGIGAKLASEFALGAGWALLPEARLGFNYDVLRDEVSPLSRFVAGGPAFATPGLTPARTAAEAGAGLTFAGPAGTELTLSYEGEFRDRYDSHTGVVRLRQAF